jgi:microcompartment protein CcmK/EutM
MPRLQQFCAQHDVPDDIEHEVHMILGKVVGTVWATRKDEELVGMKFQIVKHVDLDYKLKDTFVVAVDTVQAGVGDIVLMCSGSSARQTALTKNKPVDAVIMAVVDKLDVAD